MPIRVKCQCQQQFDARDDLSGRTVKCPKCAAPITIPNPAAAPRQAPAPPSAMAGLLDEVGVKHRVATGCPGCGAGYAPDAVICVECGYNFRTGRKLETKKVEAGPMEGMGGGGHGVNAEFLIQKARHDMEAERAMQKKMVSFGIPWWGYLLMLIGVVGFIVGMGSLPQDVAMQIAGGMLMTAGVLMSVVGGIWIRVIAFRESTTQGILVLLVPIYDLIFTFTHWDECAAPFFLGFFSGTVFSMGYLAYALAPMLVKEEGEAMLLYFQTSIFV